MQFYHMRNREVKQKNPPPPPSSGGSSAVRLRRTGSLCLAFDSIFVGFR